MFEQCNTLPPARADSILQRKERCMEPQIGFGFGSIYIASHAHARYALQAMRHGLFLYCHMAPGYRSFEILQHGMAETGRINRAHEYRKWLREEMDRS